MDSDELIRSVAWPLELTYARRSERDGACVSAVRWRDAAGRTGQSSIGEIVHQVGRGKRVTVAGAEISLAGKDGRSWLVAGGGDELIAALPGWEVL
jgi:hypothetical protein